MKIFAVLLKNISGSIQSINGLRLGNTNEFIENLKYSYTKYMTVYCVVKAQATLEYKFETRCREIARYLKWVEKTSNKADHWIYPHGNHLLKLIYLIIQEVKTKRITTVKEVWIPGLNYHIFWQLYLSVYYLVSVSVEKIYQTFETVLWNISYPNILNFVKNTLLCIIYSTLISVFWISQWNTISHVWCTNSKLETVWAKTLTERNILKIQQLRKYTVYLIDNAAGKQRGLTFPMQVKV